MCGVSLLQFHDDVSDGEAMERCRYGLRWKVALELPLDNAGFHPSSLSVFRSRLAAYGKERHAFDRFIQVGREAGFIPDKVSLLIDTTWVKGAGAVQDIYTLIRKSVRKLLKAMDYHLAGKRQRCGQEIAGMLGKYVDQDHRAEIDSVLKQYFKENRALRTETIINNPKDFGVRMDISNLPFLQKIGREINRRLLDVQRISHNCHLSQESVERVVQPTVTPDGQRAPGLRFGQARTMCLLAALTLFVHNTYGFRHHDLLPQVADLLGSNYSTHQLTYAAYVSRA